MTTCSAVTTSSGMAITTHPEAALLYRLEAIALRRRVKAQATRLRATLAAALPFGADEAATLTARAERLRRQAERVETLSRRVAS